MFHSRVGLVARTVLPCLAFVALMVPAGCDRGDPVATVVPSVLLDSERPVGPQLASLVAQGAIPAADVNYDGVIDIRDLILVAQSIGQPLFLPIEALDLLDVRLRVTQKNEIWWREAWQVTLRNNTHAWLSVDIAVELQDADGFIVDTDVAFGVRLAPRATDTITGSTLSDAAWADTITRAVASVEIEGYTPVGDEPSPGDIDVLELAVRVAEQNDVWWRFAWRLTLTNTTDRALTFDATIDLQDSDGFIVDTDLAFGLALEPGETRTFGGFALVSSEPAELISQYAATWR